MNLNTPFLSPVIASFCLFVCLITKPMLLLAASDTLVPSAKDQSAIDPSAIDPSEVDQNTLHQTPMDDHESVACVLDLMKKTDKNTRVIDLFEACNSALKNHETLNEPVLHQAPNDSPNTAPISIPIPMNKIQLEQNSNNESLIAKKLVLEEALNDNPRAITSHNINYLIPLSYNANPNRAPGSSSFGTAPFDDSMRHLEAKFQLSVKVRLFEPLPNYSNQLYFGFSVLSLWQVFDSEQSSPFRETNYEPELFWQVPFELNILNTEVNLARLGISHQSNGQSIPYSRSWNRLYASFEWESGDWIFNFKPWYRLPESNKTDPTEAAGDDNPNIERYLGYFEFRSVLQGHRNEIGIMMRNNLRSDNKGALQIDWSYPTKYSLKPYVQVFYGYGESLIDYNHFVRRIGIGILLTEWI